MVRPCVARIFRRSGRCGLASMYPASAWSDSAPGHNGYRRAYDLITGQASKRAIWVTSVRMRREDRSSIVVSASRRPRRVRCLVTSSIVPHFALFLCSCLAVVPSSRPASADAPRAEGCQGRPSCCPDVLLYRCQAPPCMRLLKSSAISQQSSLSSSQFLCSTWNPVSSSRPTRVGSRRAQGLSGPSRRSALASARSFPGRALTAPSTAARLLWSG